MTTSVAWSVALDQLEDDVRRAEHDPETLPESWRPPAGLGPLPVGLADRAARLVARQQAVLHDLAVRLSTTARHQSLVAALDSRSVYRHRSPVYVDVNA